MSGKSSPAVLTNEALSDFLYYRKLPQLYRTADAENDYNLQKYIKAVTEGAYANFFEQAAAMKELVDPWKCPSKYLPFLYESWGLPYFEDIGEYYNRKFLSNVCEILKRRGTMGGVRYIVRTLTGMESELNYYRVNTETEVSRNLDVKPIFPTVESLNDVEVTAYTIQRFLQMHIPFYIRAFFFPEVKPQILTGELFNLLAMTEHRADNLIYERERVLKTNIVNALGMFSITDNDLFVPRKVSRLNLDLTKVKSLSDLVGYDLTGLKGNRVPIEEWITSGSFKLKLDRQLVNGVFSTLEHDLSTDIRSYFWVTRNIGKAVLDVKRYDNLAERVRKLETLRSSLLNFEGYPEYDLTGLKGEKREIIEPIHKDYLFDLENFYQSLGGQTREYDLTSLLGEKQYERAEDYMLPEWQDLNLLRDIVNYAHYVQEQKIDDERVQQLKAFIGKVSAVYETQDYDLQLPYRKVFHIEEKIAKGVVETKDYDHSEERVKPLFVSRGYSEELFIRNEHDFTKLKGDKIPINEGIEEEYLLDVERAYKMADPSPIGEYDLTGLEGEKHSTIDPAELFTDSQDLTLLHDFHQLGHTFSEDFNLAEGKEQETKLTLELKRGGKVVTQTVSFGVEREKVTNFEIGMSRKVYMHMPVAKHDFSFMERFIDLTAQRGYTNILTGITHSDLRGDRFQRIAGSRSRLPYNFEVKRYDLIKNV